MISKRSAMTTNPSSPALTAHDAGRVYAFRGITLPAGASRECRAGYAEAEAEMMESQAARLLGKASAKAASPAERKERATAGGKAAQAKLTPEQRSARGKAAAQARWAKAKGPECGQKLPGKGDR